MSLVIGFGLEEEEEEERRFQRFMWLVKMLWSTRCDVLLTLGISSKYRSSSCRMNVILYKGKEAD